MSRHKIMVVDDNSATRRMVRNALQRGGHTVVEAPDAATARALMRSEQPQLVLQDLMLPDADGFVLVGELRKIAGERDVSILAFSGFVSELDEARVSTVGFDDIISKPVAPSRLVPLIEAHLPATMPVRDKFGAGRRLVIADDDPLQLKLANFRLTQVGFDVVAVPDGQAALEAARAHPPDVIVSDVMMPGLDGFGLAMEIRQDPQLRRLPVLLITSSYVEPADRELARRAGATDLLPRTPELVELLVALSTTLAEATPTPSLPASAVAELEREHSRRVFRQLERQVMLNTGLAKRCSSLASELTVLAGISELVLEHRDVDVALDEAIAECFDAGGISVGALYLTDGPALRVRPIGTGATQESRDELASLFGHEQLLRDTLTSGQTLYVQTTDVHGEVHSQLLERAHANAMLLVPLIQRGETLGGLLMIARGRELEHEDWTAFAHGVATQICHVITLARAYEAREVAERRAVEHAALLDAIVGNAPDYVMHIELDGTIRFLNRTLGPYQQGPVVGQNVLDFPGGDHQRELRAALGRLVATGVAQGFEAAVVRDDGTTVWYSTRLGPVTQHGKLSGAVVVSRDVSEKKHTEMHLMVADRMASVGTLAAGVAHEINNPLASVIANLDMAIQDVTVMAARGPLAGDLAEELADARSAADRVREIVRDLKIFSRAEEDRHGAVDVHIVLESTLRMAWNELRHRARVVKRFSKVPLVEANESRLGQVFLNLIINAAHAIPTGNYDANTVTIETGFDRLTEHVVVSIIDTGTGIPPAVRPRMFTPFFTTKPVGVGTGLGLAISHRIITQLGGSITFDTEVGKGTEFRIMLPVAAGAMPERAPARITGTPSLRRGKVLVVDDEEPLAQAIRKYLSVDHDVTAVHSARAALDLLLAGQRYDLVLCDLMMPQTTGMELHSDVLALDPEQAARMVFLTGGAFTASAREFLDTTTNRKLEKPFDLKELRRLVNELVS